MTGSKSTGYQNSGDVDNRVRENYRKQGFLRHAKAQLAKVSPGMAEIILPFSADVDQHYGFFHGGAIATIVDGAAGAAAYSLLEGGAGVLTTEFKINFLAPAKGDRLIARGKVIKPGRRLIICQGDAFIEQDGSEMLVATALLTMMQVPASRNREKNTEENTEGNRRENDVTE